ncbi:hypothetical protein FNB15_07305 [Ferrovibrio terrae]|uniref:Uncharacterized protein n=1 Tax=Ferrovibrio terrae TaxID=2594003 RepID=A0A516GZY9_9PROT|nr:hypothetical protein [Ferrovibrio terrae]QDO97094.1 hypothetical protein FNB15_07305 [Ferrovibrio terrae]
MDRLPITGEIWRLTRYRDTWSVTGPEPEKFLDEVAASLAAISPHWHTAVCQNLLAVPDFMIGSDKE